MFAILALICAFTSQANSYVIQCPTPPFAPKGANITKIEGRWYEIARTSVGSQDFSKCITTDFSVRSDGDFNLAVISTQPDGSRVGSYGVAKRTASQNILNIQSFPINLPSLVGYNIVEADYDNYYAAYTCTSIPPYFTVLESAWILSRKPTLDASKLAMLTDLLVSEYGVERDEIESIWQKDCQYQPVSWNSQEI